MAEVLEKPSLENLRLGYKNKNIIPNYMRVNVPKIEQMTIFEKMQMLEFSNQQFKILNNCGDPNDVFWAELSNILEDCVCHEIVNDYMKEL